jgi:hypothetical protein
MARRLDFPESIIYDKLFSANDPAYAALDQRGLAVKDFFISYATPDYRKARWIRDVFKEARHSWIMYEDNMSPFQSYRENIPEALQNAYVMVVCASPQYRARQDCQTEFNLMPASRMLIVLMEQFSVRIVNKVGARVLDINQVKGTNEQREQLLLAAKTRLVEVKSRPLEKVNFPQPRKLTAQQVKDMTRRRPGY